MWALTFKRKFWSSSIFESWVIHSGFCGYFTCIFCFLSGCKTLRVECSSPCRQTAHKARDANALVNQAGRNDAHPYNQRHQHRQHDVLTRLLCGTIFKHANDTSSSRTVLKQIQNNAKECVCDSLKSENTTLIWRTTCPVVWTGPFRLGIETACGCIIHPAYVTRKLCIEIRLWKTDKQIWWHRGSSENVAYTQLLATGLHSWPKIMKDVSAAWHSWNRFGCPGCLFRE